MPKWCEVLARVFPWIPTEDDDTRRLVDEAAAITDEATAQAPFVSAQSDYLVAKSALNGFTGQLRAGFQQRSTEQ